LMIFNMILWRSGVARKVIKGANEFRGKKGPDQKSHSAAGKKGRGKGKRTRRIAVPKLEKKG